MSECLQDDAYARRQGPPAGPPIRLLAEDPDLGAGVDPRLLPRLREVVTVPSLATPAGPWIPPCPKRPTDVSGLLVVEGLLARRLFVNDHCASELLTPGDLLRPWQAEGGSAVLGEESEWHVLRPVRLAVLEQTFASWVQRLPSLHVALLARALKRSRSLAVTLAIAGEPRLETRLLMLLWHLAEKLGSRTSEGALFELPLTQQILGELVAASRARTSSALQRLESNGLIERRGRRGMLLLAKSEPLRET